MKIAQAALAAALAAAVCACSAPQKRAAAIAPPVVTTVSALGAEPASAASVDSTVLEPALCARLSGPPQFDAQELGCIVGWMRSAQDYLYRGGAPTKYTNEEEFNVEKKTALDMLATETKMLTDAKWEPKADTVVAAAAPAANAGRGSSSQRYLEGVIAYQKGDYIQARAAWTDAVKLDPSNSDAQAGLELLDKAGAR